MTRASAAIEFGATVTALAIVPACVFFLVRHFVPDLPFSDEWDVNVPIALAFDAGHVDFGLLWNQHNEHRLLFPNLIVLALTAVGGYDVGREALASVACCTLELAVVLRLLARIATGPLRAATFAVASLLLFSLGQAENWTWGFQLAWFLANLCAVAAFSALATERVRVLDVGVALVLASGAVFSLAAGLLVLPAGALLLFARSRRIDRALALWLGGSLALVAAFAHGYARLDSPYHLHGALATVAGPALAYFLANLGGPFGARDGALVSIGFGLLGVALVGVLGWRVRDRLFPLATPFAAPVGIIAYAWLAAAASTYGRAGAGVDIALSSRYETTALAFWIGLLLLATAAYAEGHIGPPRVAAACAVGAACVFGISYGRMQATGYQAMIDFRYSVLAAREALVRWPAAGSAPLKGMYPDAKRLLELAAELSAHDASVAAKLSRITSARGGTFAYGVVDDAAESATTADAIDIRGWAVRSILPWNAEAGSAIEVSVDGKPCACVATYGTARPDVQANVGNPKALKSGFDVRVPTATLAAGRHVVSLALVANGARFPLVERVDVRR